jgi:hypothetical protein
MSSVGWLFESLADAQKWTWKQVAREGERGREGERERVKERKRKREREREGEREPRSGPGSRLPTASPWREAISSFHSP